MTMVVQVWGWCWGLLDYRMNKLLEILLEELSCQFLISNFYPTFIVLQFPNSTIHLMSNIWISHAVPFLKP